MERLAGLVEKAVECVRNLQDYIRAEKLIAAMRTELDEGEQQIEDPGVTGPNPASEPRTRR